MKRLTLLVLAIGVAFSALLCTRAPVTVESVAITPPGDTVQTTLTAQIEATGTGALRVDWYRAAYDSVRLLRSDTIDVKAAGTYASVLDSALGWCWLDIYRAPDSLLWHTDSVFCGPDTLPPQVSFYPDWEYGPHPLRVTFYNDTKPRLYSRAFWNFDDGQTSTEWEPVHQFDDPGQYRIVLRVSAPSGSDADSLVVYVW